NLKDALQQQGNKKLNEARIHPTQKPVKLYEWLLTNYAKPTDRILDTHLGSGSSAIAAHYFGCEFVGIEVDEDYFNAAVDRIREQTKQLDLLA
ncbi:MAG: site-specific DNA-methyltransferase, partial [Aliifodinibius sp.]|nr:site-specific DNA-methyltransferase [Fodinibius sp.]NIV11060.1 site-specific DNA-methyltransferase [Fodinibius sp.]NIY24640.1 site-specific DNA-methyltransferase [Fodinibius sp.]